MTISASGNAYKTYTIRSNDTFRSKNYKLGTGGTIDIILKNINYQVLFVQFTTGVFTTFKKLRKITRNR